MIIKNYICLLNKGIIFGISIFLFLLICLIACKRAKFQRSLNIPLPNVTNSRFNSHCRVRLPNTINRNDENLVLQNPDVYQISLNEYQNRSLTNEQQTNFQKATKDDLPSYEDIFLSTEKKT